MGIFSSDEYGFEAQLILELFNNLRAGRQSASTPAGHFAAFLTLLEHKVKAIASAPQGGFSVTYSREAHERVLAGLQERIERWRAESVAFEWNDLLERLDASLNEQMKDMSVQASFSMATKDAPFLLGLLDDRRSTVLKAKEQIALALGRAVPAAPADPNAQELDRLREARVKKALVWWRTEGIHYADPAWLSNYVAMHRDKILAEEELIRQDFESGQDMCSSLEKCLTLADWALANLANEVVYHFPSQPPPNRDRLARILRDHYGHWREVLLPAARTATPAAPSEQEDILAVFPEEERRELAAALRRENFSDDDERVLAFHRRQREQRGDPPDTIEQSVSRLRLNLQAIHDRHARAKRIL